VISCSTGTEAPFQGSTRQPNQVYQRGFPAITQVDPLRSSKTILLLLESIFITQGGPHGPCWFINVISGKVFGLGPLRCASVVAVGCPRFLVEKRFAI